MEGKFLNFFQENILSFLSKIGCILGICEVFYKNVPSGVMGQQLACAPPCCSLMGERVGGVKVRRLTDKDSLIERKSKERGEKLMTHYCPQADFCPACP